MADLKIFSYLPNPRIAKATIAAKYSGTDIEIIGDAPKELVHWLWDHNGRRLTDDEKDSYRNIARTGKVGFAGVTLYKTDAFLKANPFGNVPAAFLEEGEIGIFESNAIMRAAVRSGPKQSDLLGRSSAEQSRVDAFLDRSLVFARDAQKYLLAEKKLDADLHEETKTSLISFAAGLDSVLSHSSHLTGDYLTIADIGVLCELCLFTNESRHSEALQELNLELLLPLLTQFAQLGKYVGRLAGSPDISSDLNPYLQSLVKVWDS